MKNNLLSKITPSRIELLLLTLVAFLVPVLAHVRELIDSILIGRDSGVTSASLIETLASNIKESLNLFDALSFSPSVALILFWGLMGVVVYSVGSVFITVATEVKNDVDIAAHYLHPKHYSKLHVLYDVTIYSLKNTVIYLLLFIVALFLFRFAIPWTVSSFTVIYFIFSLEEFVVYLLNTILLGMTLWASFIFVRALWGLPK